MGSSPLSLNAFHPPTRADFQARTFRNRRKRDLNLLGIEQPLSGADVHRPLFAGYLDNLQIGNHRTELRFFAIGLLIGHRAEGVRWQLWKSGRAVTGGRCTRASFTAVRRWALRRLWGQELRHLRSDAGVVALEGPPLAPYVDAREPLRRQEERDRFLVTLRVAVAEVGHFAGDVWIVTCNLRSGGFYASSTLACVRDLAARCVRTPTPPFPSTSRLRRRGRLSSWMPVTARTETRSSTRAFGRRSQARALPAEQVRAHPHQAHVREASRHAVGRSHHGVEGADDDRGPLACAHAGSPRGGRRDRWCRLP